MGPGCERPPELGPAEALGSTGASHDMLPEHPVTTQNTVAGGGGQVDVAHLPRMEESGKQVLTRLKKLCFGLNLRCSLVHNWKEAFLQLHAICRMRCTLSFRNLN